jgi:hypothetical protein
MKNAWRLAPTRHPWGRAAYLLLRLDERLLLPLLPEEERLPPRALARSLWALLFWVLALPPLLAACARLVLLDDEGDDLPDEEEEELRDAIACSIGSVDEGRPSRSRPHGQSRQTRCGGCR